MVRESKDYKFDFKLFPFLKQYDYAYKIYLDEALLSLRNISKTANNTLKKGDYVDHSLIYMIFTKLVVFHSLNYADVQKVKIDNSKIYNNFL